MRKILLAIIAVVVCMTANAQYMQVYDTKTSTTIPVATYINTENHTYQVVLKCLVRVTNIGLSLTADVSIGLTKHLKATVTPENATFSTPIWSSSNESVATVDANGIVKGVAEGTATITATAADESGVTASCVVTVKNSVLFTVAENKTVQFTTGNLYWDGSAYHFEANQYDCQNNTSDYNRWNTSHVNHFYWTNLTDYKSGNASYMPYAENYNYSIVGREDKRTKEDKFWCGEDNKLTVDDVKDCYALTSAEWTYLLNKDGSSGRSDANRFALARVNDVRGLLIFPDGYATVPSDAGIAKINTTGIDIPTTSVSATNWSAMESAGVVFLPVTGFRASYSLQQGGGFGYYWTATPSSGYIVNAYCLYSATTVSAHTTARGVTKASLCALSSRFYAILGSGGVFLRRQSTVRPVFLLK